MIIFYIDRIIVRFLMYGIDVVAIYCIGEYVYASLYTLLYLAILIMSMYPLTMRKRRKKRNTQ